RQGPGMEQSPRPRPTLAAFRRASGGARADTRHSPCRRRAVSRRRTLRGAARPQGAHHEDHGGDRPGQGPGYGRKGWPVPPRTQDLPEARLSERGEPRGKLRIVGGEHALHLLEDALLIHGKRHVSPPPPPVARPSDGTFLTIPCWTIIYLGMTKG